MLNERTGPFLSLGGKKPNYSMKQLARDRRFAGEQIPAPKNGSKELKAIVLKACAYDPKDRYQSAEEMLEALHVLYIGSATAAVPIKQSLAAKQEEAEELTVVPGWAKSIEEIETETMTSGTVWEHKTIAESDSITVGSSVAVNVLPTEELKIEKRIYDSYYAEISRKQKIRKYISIAAVIVVAISILLMRAYDQTPTNTSSYFSELAETTVNDSQEQHHADTDRLDVRPEEKQLTTISVRTNPNKTSYYLGETLDTSGLTLTATYNDGTTEIITKGFAIKPNKLYIAGTQNVTVSNCGESVLLSVFADEPTISLSEYNKTEKENGNSYWIDSYGAPFWKIYLPDVITSPGGGTVSWSIMSGSAYIADGYIAAQKAGTIIARATYTYCGRIYTADYTVQLVL